MRRPTLASGYNYDLRAPNGRLRLPAIRSRRQNNGRIDWEKDPQMDGERERERALTQYKLERCPAEAELKGRGGR